MTRSRSGVNNSQNFLKNAYLFIHRLYTSRLRHVCKQHKQRCRNRDKHGHQRRRSIGHNASRKASINDEPWKVPRCCQEPTGGWTQSAGPLIHLDYLCILVHLGRPTDGKFGRDGPIVPPSLCSNFGNREPECRAKHCKPCDSESSQSCISESHSRAVMKVWKW